MSIHMWAHCQDNVHVYIYSLIYNYNSQETGEVEIWVYQNLHCRFNE